MVEPPRTEKPAPDRSEAAGPVVDLADEVERERTPRTPFLALTGVGLGVAVVAGLGVAVVVALVLALALTLYFVYGGR
jgi:hypothetical protein